MLDLHLNQGKRREEEMEYLLKLKLFYQVLGLVIVCVGLIVLAAILHICDLAAGRKESPL